MNGMPAFMRSNNVYRTNHPPPRGSTKTNPVRFLLNTKISLMSSCLLMTFAFYVGTVFGSSLGLFGDGNITTTNNNDFNKLFTQEDLDRIIKDRILNEKFTWQKEQALIQKNNSKIPNNNSHNDPNSHNNDNNNDNKSSSYLSPGMKSVFNGMARISAVDFHEEFDYGYPTNDGSSDEVVILYLNSRAVPSSISSDSNSVPLLSVSDATSSCEAMNVATVSASEGKNTCLVVSGGYESFHLQRWMRNGEKAKGQSGELSSNYPLRHVSRGMKRNGADDFHPPKMVDIQTHWGPLRRYLETYDEVTAQLKPILESIAINNTIIVMVCNMGQASLLMNFACSAKARGFDLKNVLVFATDKETLDMAEGLGLTAFYDDKNFGDMPTEEAKRYGDRKFVAMMYAKVVCVQIVNMLGYDVLFQDVDIVWYKDPLVDFHDKNSHLADYDVLFQDDGARSLRYAPYSANSGFYYVRNNDRTRYLFTSLLYSSDLIASLHSHQQVLTAFITEHSSLFGTKIKTLDGKAYPGGYHYHREKTLMKQIVSGDYIPSLFHMSWTNNKDNKLLFFKQMGLWYLKEQCEVYENIPTGGMADCCSVNPIVSCHYRDKPSLIPCKESPPIDAGRPSFW